MRFKYYYYYFKEILSKKFCNDVISFAEERQKLIGFTGNLAQNRNMDKEPLTKKELKILKKHRDSNVVWLKDYWIYKEILPWVEEANRRAGWNFQIETCEDCQFTTYKKNQFYDWHFDSWDGPYQDGIYKGKIRKLSVTVSLTDPKKYKGGELEFNFQDERPDKKSKSVVCKDVLPRGSLVVFPSFVWHRVKPVTYGTRQSLVIWNLGKPFI
jgi:PKHD-type hydroxylase